MIDTFFAVLPLGGAAGHEAYSDQAVTEGKLFHPAQRFFHFFPGLLPPFFGNKRIHGRIIGLEGLCIQISGLTFAVTPYAFFRMLPHPFFRRVQPQDRQDVRIRDCFQDGFRFKAELLKRAGPGPFRIADDPEHADARFSEFAVVILIQLQRLPCFFAFRREQELLSAVSSVCRRDPDMPVRADFHHHRGNRLSVDHQGRSTVPGADLGFHHQKTSLQEFGKGGMDDLTDR